MKQEKLTGIYKVSFNIELDSQDELALSDLSFLLTEGVGEALASKVSHLSVQKVEKTGNQEPKVLKVGDKVQLKSTITLTASIYEDDGYFFVGTPTEISNEVVKQQIVLEAGSIGYVNKVDGSTIEIIDLDCVASIPLDNYSEVASIDLITANVEQLEKIDSEEGK